MSEKPEIKNPDDFAQMISDAGDKFTKEFEDVVWSVGKAKGLNKMEIKNLLRGNLTLDHMSKVEAELGVKIVFVPK